MAVIETSGYVTLKFTPELLLINGIDKVDVDDLVFLQFTSVPGNDRVGNDIRVKNVVVAYIRHGDGVIAKADPNIEFPPEDFYQHPTFNRFFGKPEVQKANPDDFDLVFYPEAFCLCNAGRRTFLTFRNVKGISYIKETNDIVAEHRGIGLRKLNVRPHTPAEVEAGCEILREEIQRYSSEEVPKISTPIVVKEKQTNEPQTSPA